MQLTMMYMYLTLHTFLFIPYNVSGQEEIIIWRQTHGNSRADLHNKTGKIYLFLVKIREITFKIDCFPRIVHNFVECLSHRCGHTLIISFCDFLWQSKAFPFP